MAHHDHGYCDCHWCRVEDDARHDGWPFDESADDEDRYPHTLDDERDR